MKYICSNCKEEVEVVNEQIQPKCQCNAPILAEMSAIVHGVGGLK